MQLYFCAFIYVHVFEPNFGLMVLIDFHTISESRSWKMIVILNAPEKWVQNDWNICSVSQWTVFCSICSTYRGCPRSSSKIIWNTHAQMHYICWIFMTNVLQVGCWEWYQDSGPYLCRGSAISTHMIRKWLHERNMSPPVRTLLVPWLLQLMIIACKKTYDVAFQSHSPVHAHTKASYNLFDRL